MPQNNSTLKPPRKSNKFHNCLIPKLFSHELNYDKLPAWGCRCRCVYDQRHNVWTVLYDLSFNAGKVVRQARIFRVALISAFHPWSFPPSDNSGQTGNWFRRMNYSNGIMWLDSGPLPNLTTETWSKRLFHTLCIICTFVQIPPSNDINRKEANSALLRRRSTGNLDRYNRYLLHKLLIRVDWAYECASFLSLFQAS